MGPGIVLLRLIGRGAEGSLVGSTAENGKVDQHSAKGLDPGNHRRLGTSMGAKSETHRFIRDS